MDAGEMRAASRGPFWPGSSYSPHFLVHGARMWRLVSPPPAAGSVVAGLIAGVPYLCGTPLDPTPLAPWLTGTATWPVPDADELARRLGVPDPSDGARAALAAWVGDNLLQDGRDLYRRVGLPSLHTLGLPDVYGIHATRHGIPMNGRPDRYRPYRDFLRRIGERAASESVHEHGPAVAEAFDDVLPDDGDVAAFVERGSIMLLQTADAMASARRKTVTEAARMGIADRVDALVPVVAAHALGLGATTARADAIGAMRAAAADMVDASPHPVTRSWLLAVIDYVDLYARRRALESLPVPADDAASLAAMGSGR